MRGVPMTTVGKGSVGMKGNDKNGSHLFARQTSMRFRQRPLPLQAGPLRVSSQSGVHHALVVRAFVPCTFRPSLFALLT